MSKKRPSVLKLNNFQEKDNIKPDFYIKTFQEHKAEHPFVMDPHSHDFYLISLFKKGRGTHTIDFNTFEIKKGSIFFMSPGEMHSWKLSADTDGYVIFFNSSFYRMDAQVKHLNNFAFFRANNRQNHGVLNSLQIEAAERIIRLMETESKTESSSLPSVLRALLDALLYKLSSFPEIKNDPHLPESLVPQLEILIEKHYREHQPATFYADQLNITTQQMNKYTRDYLNKTVSDLVQERLIAEAKRLLVYSGLSVSEIAYELNFNDNSYFNRFFKRSEKLTPEQFRKRFN